MQRFVLLLAAFASALTCRGAESSVTAAKLDEDGCLVHRVESPYQRGTTRIRVLVPADLKPSESYRTIYVLPVEAADGNKYGDGLREIQKHDLHNKHQVIFVGLTFSHLPWYADHPTDPGIRQESHILKVVVPFVDRTYPVPANSQGRLLLGFSKSGWGAWSLLLRHPEVFGRAAAWDAPLMLDHIGKYGSADVFGNQATFEQYQISKLLSQRRTSLFDEKRLILLGYGGFRDDHAKIHVLLDEGKIPHAWRDGPARKHDWHSGWVPEAIELLVGTSAR